MSRFARLAIAMALCLASVPQLQAADVRVTARRDGDAVLVEAHADLRADVELAWAVLTDYGRYAQFVPDLQSSQVLSRDGNNVLIEQRGTAGFFLFRFPMEVRLAVTEEPLERVVCRLVSGNFKELDGIYELRSVAQGIRFAYHGRLVPAFSLPPLIGLPAVRASVERQFGGLVREIERRRAATEPVDQ